MTGNKPPQGGPIAMPGSPGTPTPPPPPPLTEEEKRAQRRAERRAKRAQRRAESEAAWAATPRWGKAIAIAIALAAIGVIVWLVVAGLTAVFGALVPKPAEQAEPTKTNVVLVAEQELAPASELPSGTAITDGRIQCATDFESITFSKSGKKTSSEGDVYTAKWTAKTVTLKITAGTPGKIVGTPQAIIFGGGSTTVAKVEPPPAVSADELRLVADFSAGFAASAPAKSATVCVK